ncbi:MAG TPA: ROK family protein [Candidatus Angelobacter sp.]|jgi:glucokinase|nr:ROK family protein [Candidatus Angelobacter sp.]
MYGAIDIGGTKLLAAVAGGDLRPQRTVRRATPPDDPIATLSAMLDEARGGEGLDAIAVATPGPFDRERGTMLLPPNLPPAWQMLPLAEALSARYGCPVLVENDANCAALAEALHGAAAGLAHVMYYTVSTGIGSGVVHDGRLLLGRHDTEGGHQVLWPSWLGGAPPCGCGGSGCLEALASGSAIARRFGVRADQLDDADAWADVGRWLGLAVVNATALHDPDAVVFGGGVCNAWHRFWPSMSATIDTHLRLQPVPRILRAALGEDRNMWGALALLRDRAG